MKKTALFGALLSATTLLAGAAQAGSVEGMDTWAKERFQIRGRALAVISQEDSSTNIGGKIDADNSIVPELDFSYFFTDNVSAELIAGVTPHDINAKGTAIGNVDLGDVWLLPPTVTLQYHFAPEGKVNPYLGAGLGYIWYFDENPGAATDISYDSGIAYALQAGVDVPIDEHWMFNVDVKKLWHNVDAKVNGGAVTADVDLDPLLVGVGFGYRF